jgi:hypothetical protein
VNLPEVHIETDGTPMHTKVILKTEDGLEWDISNFTTRIEQMGGERGVGTGRALRTAHITIVANTDLPTDGEPLTIDANTRRPSPEPIPGVDP